MSHFKCSVLVLFSILRLNLNFICDVMFRICVVTETFSCRSIELVFALKLVSIFYLRIFDINKVTLNRLTYMMFMCEQNQWNQWNPFNSKINNSLARQLEHFRLTNQQFYLVLKQKIISKKRENNCFAYTKKKTRNQFIIEITMKSEFSLNHTKRI